MPVKENELSSLGEFGLIETIAGILGKKGAVKSIGDDTAVIKVNSDRFLLFTTEMFVEGVHFTKKTAAGAIGHKALAANISDIAAMGGLPRYAVVSLGLPRQTKIRFVREIYQGMRSLARQFQVHIVGGDTIRNNRLVISVALLGEVKKKDVVLRSGARKGNRIFVAGRLGRSLQTGRHLSFQPRIAESQYLVKNFHPTAMIDMSDGLVSDLGHILKESRAGAFLFKENIPKNNRATLESALYDGEDFELLFTLPAKAAERLKKTKHRRFHFFYIGDITDKKNKLILIDKRGKRKNLKLKGFKHF